MAAGGKSWTTLASKNIISPDSSLRAITGFGYKFKNTPKS
jgi:hypothetical protein